MVVVDVVVVVGKVSVPRCGYLWMLILRLIVENVKVWTGMHLNLTDANLSLEFEVSLGNWHPNLIHPLSDRSSARTVTRRRISLY